MNTGKIIITLAELRTSVKAYGSTHDLFQRDLRRSAFEQTIFTNISLQRKSDFNRNPNVVNIVIVHSYSSLCWYTVQKAAKIHWKAAIAKIGLECYKITFKS